MSLKYRQAFKNTLCAKKRGSDTSFGLNLISGENFNLRSTNQTLRTCTEVSKINERKSEKDPKYLKPPSTANIAQSHSKSIEKDSLIHKSLAPQTLYGNCSGSIGQSAEIKPCEDTCSRSDEINGSILVMIHKLPKE